MNQAYDLIDEHEIAALVDPEFVFGVHENKTAICRVSALRPWLGAGKESFALAICLRLPLRDFARAGADGHRLPFPGALPRAAMNWRRLADRAACRLT